MQHMQYYLPRNLAFDNLEYCLEQYNYQTINIVETYSPDKKNKIKVVSDKKPTFDIKDETISLFIENKLAYRKISQEFFSAKKHVQCRSAIEYEFTKYGEVAQYIKEPDQEQYPPAQQSIFKIIIDEDILCVGFADHIPLIPHSKIGLKKYYQVDKKE